MGPVVGGVNVYPVPVRGETDADLQAAWAVPVGEAEEGWRAGATVGEKADVLDGLGGEGGRDKAAAKTVTGDHTEAWREGLEEFSGAVVGPVHAFSAQG